MITPLVTVEEHHEAFYVWNHAIRRGWIQPTHNTLLHVDHHADMELPDPSRPISSIGDDFDLARFTYNELNIANFVLAGSRRRIYNRILWMKVGHMRPGLVVPTRLVGGPGAGVGEGVIAVDFVHHGANQAIPNDQPVLLDIDLDYFCCNEHPEGEHEIEVTRAVFEEFLGNPYHFLRLPPSNRATAATRDGRYFLRFNESRRASDRPDAAGQILKRVADLAANLDASAVTPSLILLCRSVHSGYTPERHVDFIEDSLLSAFRDRYMLQTMYITDLLPCSFAEMSETKEVLV